MLWVALGAFLGAFGKFWDVLGVFTRGIQAARKAFWRLGCQGSFLDASGKRLGTTNGFENTSRTTGFGLDAFGARPGTTNGFENTSRTPGFGLLRDASGTLE